MAAFAASAVAPCITASSNSPTASAKRRSILRSLLHHSRFSLLMWSVFLLMSFIMVIHNLALQSWGIGTFDSITRRVERQGEQGFYKDTPLFDAEGKPTILAYAWTPVGRFMHILPAGLWSVIAPLQLSPTFRAKHRTAHRRLGRMFIILSISMSVGIVPLVLYGTDKIQRSIVADGGLFSFTAYFLVTGLLAVVHARNKRHADHRVWILRHVAMGYSAHLQRLLAIPSWWIFPRVWAGYADLTPEGAQKRRLVFGLYFVVSVILSVTLMEIWLRHTTRSGVVPMEGGPNKADPRKNRSS